MINPFLPGDQKVFETIVTDEKLARFDAGLVHPVYSTFFVAKDAEWACRLFVLEMKEEGEEGIGGYVSVNHVSPAKLGSKIKIVATLKSVVKNTIECSYEVFVGERLIAFGDQTQKIINKSKFDEFLNSL